MPICILGDLEDLTTVYVKWLAAQRGLEVLSLPESKLGESWSFEFDDGIQSRGWITHRENIYRFEDLQGAFVRLNPRPALPAGVVLPASQELAFVQERRNGIYQLLENLPCPVVNRTTGGRSNGSKPYQMRQLAQLGFRIPKWIVTNDVEVARAFAGHFPNSPIYKSLSGLRSKVRKLDEAALDRLAEGGSPVIVQEYIGGRDVRIHTVKEKAFATEVLGEGIDYRFEERASTYAPTEAPVNIEALCFEAAEYDNLLLAGLDFRVTPDGVWYCLEMNPVPTFMPYDLGARQPIGEAILDLFKGSWNSASLE